MNRDEPIAVSQAEWDEVHECTFCSECELRVGCQTEPNFGCQADEKKRRGRRHVVHTGESRPAAGATPATRETAAWPR
jgi:hypothetical protein